MRWRVLPAVPWVRLPCATGAAAAVWVQMAGLLRSLTLQGTPADRASSGRAVWEGRRPPWTGCGQPWKAEGHVLPGWACSGMLGQQRPPLRVLAASSLWCGHVAWIGAQDGRGLVGPVSGCRVPVAGGQHGDLWKHDSFSQTSFPCGFYGKPFPGLSRPQRQPFLLPQAHPLPGS